MKNNNGLLDYTVAITHRKYIIQRFTSSETFTTKLIVVVKCCTDTRHRENNIDYRASRNTCHLANNTNLNFITILIENANNRLLAINLFRDYHLFGQYT